MSNNDNPHYVTTEEAYEKLCPLLPNDICVGPKCMAWRWQELPSIKDNVLQFEPRYSTTHGYCGMVRS